MMAPEIVGVAASLVGVLAGAITRNWSGMAWALAATLWALSSLMCRF